MIASFIFHNVGQGLFYSGEIGDLRIVYDCGSTRRKHLSSIVSKFKKTNLTSRKIDLLILSHLHDDHVAGLSALLKKPKISIDTAVLPYLSPIERLMVSLTKISLPRWFYEFWADPVRFLLENGVERVLLLGGSEPSLPKDEFGREGRFANEAERMDLSEMPDDSGLRREVMEKDSQWTEFLKQRRLLIKNHDGYIFTRVPHGTWIFRFFNCKVDDSNLSQFAGCIKPIVKSASLTNILKSRSRRRQLKKCYNVLHKDFNNTSILAFHAPILRKPRSSTCPFNYGGHLLTGDIDLNKKWAEIRKHFGFVLSKLSLCLVPHHGSKHNWNEAILATIPTKCHWIISSGIANRHGHPSFSVVQDIAQNGNPLHLSNEVNRFSTMLCF
jgi:hypothetical protein